MPPWKGLDDVKMTTLGWVDWRNHRRLLEPNRTHFHQSKLEGTY